ncbi:MAG TPA: lipid A-modifier LpxR family protein, partial [Gemmatimonadaceae bacterium]
MNHRSLATLLIALAAPLGAAFAQAPRPHTLTLRVDNDAFNFWAMPWDRPDGEYTSGVHITYDGARSPWWARGLFGAGVACTTGARECVGGSSEIGQDIYTPSLRASDPVPSADARPSAGWLYVSQSARWLSAPRSDELTITLGVTGQPSLARFTQRLAHSAAPEFNRPVD